MFFANNAGSCFIYCNRKPCAFKVDIKAKLLLNELVEGDELSGIRTLQKLSMVVNAIKEPLIKANAMMNNKRRLSNSLISQKVLIELFDHGATAFLIFKFVNAASFHIEKVRINSNVFDVDFTLHAPATLKAVITAMEVVGEEKVVIIKPPLNVFIGGGNIAIVCKIRLTSSGNKGKAKLLKDGTICFAAIDFRHNKNPFSWHYYTKLKGFAQAVFEVLILVMAIAAAVTQLTFIAVKLAGVGVFAFAGELFNGIAVRALHGAFSLWNIDVALRI